MKIDELKINSYGKLKDKNIKLNEGFNIIYGENEKGKSTLLNYIVNSFYGTSKNKRGKDISDFDKFKPWSGDDFSGKLTYTLDDGKRYEIFREFGKKNAKLYDENYEDVSKNYSLDKSTGSEFFTEQTNVDENTFISSVVAFQKEVELSEQTQNVLLQRMANSASSGDDSISYKKAIDKLNKKQLDEIGTSRSQGKPINVIDSEIKKLTSRNEELKKYDSYKYEIEDKKSILNDEITKLNKRIEFAEKLNRISKEENSQKEVIKQNEERIDGIEKNIQDLLNEKKKIKESNEEVKTIKRNKVNPIPYLLLALISIVIGVTVFIFSKLILSIAISVVVAAIIMILYARKNSKTKKENKSILDKNEKIETYNKDVERRKYELQAQIDLLERNKENEVNEVERIKNEIVKAVEQNKEKLFSEYHNETFISDYNNKDAIRQLDNELSRMQKSLNDKSVNLYQLEVDKKNIVPMLDEMAENEEKLKYAYEQYDLLREKNNAINIAKEIMESSYQKMRNSVTPQFTSLISDNINKITNGKYKKIVINEEDGILVELENGEYMDANRLSVGTIEQIYLAFRLAVIQNVSSETMPIILDETFAYFDDSRLAETLKNMHDNYDKHQIIILTCTDREKRILDSLGYNYNQISL